MRRKIPGARPYFPLEDIEDITREIKGILQSGRLLGINGEFSNRFEHMFKSYVGTKYAITTNSGTSALEIPLRCLGVERGSEVIVPTNTFIASPNSVIFAGGKPVFADINRETLCIDVDDAVERITDRTIGIMVVHIAGLICPQMDELAKICEDQGLFLMEDAAHAHGATYKGIKAGNLGDVGCFSFYPTKIMTTGEGGMICTNRDELPEEMKILRFDGISPEDSTVVIKLGYNWHMSELNAVLGIYQLNRLEDYIEQRNHISVEYQRGLKNLDGVHLFQKPSYIRHSYYKFPILVDEDIDTNRLITLLKEQYGIEIGRLYYPPCHLQPLYQDLMDCKPGMFPVAEDVLPKVICLPMHVQMQDPDVEYVVQSLREAINLSARTLIAAI
jgi:dTDP-4-amino-4,6-dideoxygalactose transaminase